MTEQPKELIRAALKDGCRAHCDSLIDELRRLHALNGELLEALKYHQEQTRPIERTRAAINKAEGQA